MEPKTTFIFTYRNDNIFTSRADTTRSWRATPKLPVTPESNSETTPETVHDHIDELINDFNKHEISVIAKDIVDFSKKKISNGSQTAKIAKKIWKLFNNDKPTEEQKRGLEKLKEKFFEDATLEKIKSNNIPNLLTIATAFNRIRIHDAKIFKAIALKLDRKVLSFEDVSQCILAFSQASLGLDATYSSMKQFVLKNQQRLTLNTLGNIAKGFFIRYKDSFSADDVRFMIGIYDSTKKNNNNKQQPLAENLTNIVDAYAKMYKNMSKRGLKNLDQLDNKIADIFNDLRDYVLSADDLDIHQMVKIVEGYRDVRYGYVPGQFFDKLISKFIVKADTLIITKLALLNRVCFQVGYDNEKELLKLSKMILEKKEQLTNERLVNTVYYILIGYCKSNAYSEFIKSFLEHIFEIENQEGLKNNLWKNEDLSQIHTIYHFYQSKTKDASLKMPSSLEEKIQKYLISLKKPTSTQLHENVISHLPTQEGYEKEYPYYSFFLDIANPKEKIVIEVDGIYHFYREDNKRRTKDWTKEEILKAEGWRLIRISYFEWNKMKEALEKKAYLAKKLEQL